MADETNALEQIRAIDSTILFARDMAKMKDFYSSVMKFPIVRAFGDIWIEFGVGKNTLVITPSPAGGMFPEQIPPEGVASLQLAFRVPPDLVEECHQDLEAAGIAILSPPTDQVWGHRTLFFRDPDNNILEIYAEI